MPKNLNEKLMGALSEEGGSMDALKESIEKRKTRKAEEKAQEQESPEKDTTGEKKIDSVQDKKLEVEDGDLYEKVRDFILSTRKTSPVEIAKRFKISQKKANAFFSILEKEGIIGPSENGVGPREFFGKKNDEKTTTNTKPENSEVGETSKNKNDNKSAENNPELTPKMDEASEETEPTIAPVSEKVLEEIAKKIKEAKEKLTKDENAIYEDHIAEIFDIIEKLKKGVEKNEGTGTNLEEKNGLEEARENYFKEYNNFHKEQRKRSAINKTRASILNMFRVENEKEVIGKEELSSEMLKEKEKIYFELRILHLKELEKTLSEQEFQDETKIFLASEAELRKQNQTENGPLSARLKTKVSKGIEALDKFGSEEKEGWKGKALEYGKRFTKMAVNMALIGLTGSFSVETVAKMGHGTASALGGGVTSYMGRKMLVGLGLGSIMNVEMSKKKKLALQIAVTAVSLGLAIVGGTIVPVGAAMAVGYGLSQLAQRGFSEGKIKERFEKVEKENEIVVEKLEETVAKFEKEYAEALRRAENTRIKRKVAGFAAGVVGAVATLETMGEFQDLKVEVTTTNDVQPKTGIENQNPTPNETHSGFMSGIRNTWNTISGHNIAPHGDSHPAGTENTNNVPNDQETVSNDLHTKGYLAHDGENPKLEHEQVEQRIHDLKEQQAQEEIIRNNKAEFDSQKEHESGIYSNDGKPMTPEQVQHQADIRAQQEHAKFEAEQKELYKNDSEELRSQQEHEQENAAAGGHNQTSPEQTQHQVESKHSVEITYKGGTQAILDLKEQVRHDYPDISKAPSGYQEFMKTSATDHAIKIHWFDPNNPEESANLQGTLSIDKDGILSYHDTRTDHTEVYNDGHKFEGKMFDSDHSGNSQEIPGSHSGGDVLGSHDGTIATEDPSTYRWDNATPGNENIVPEVGRVVVSEVNGEINLQGNTNSHLPNETGNNPAVTEKSEHQNNDQKNDDGIHHKAHVNHMSPEKVAHQVDKVLEHNVKHLFPTEEAMNKWHSVVDRGISAESLIKIYNEHGFNDESKSLEFLAKHLQTLQEVTGKHPEPPMESNNWKGESVLHFMKGAEKTYIEQTGKSLKV